MRNFNLIKYNFKSRELSFSRNSFFYLEVSQRRRKRLSKKKVTWPFFLCFLAD